MLLLMLNGAEECLSVIFYSKHTMVVIISIRHRPSKGTNRLVYDVSTKPYLSYRIAVAKSLVQLSHDVHGSVHHNTNRI